MLFEYFLIFAGGALAKLADAQVDELIFRRFRGAEYAVAMAYGLILGYFLTFDSLFATVALAVLVGVLLAGKIDQKAHQAAVAVAIIVAFARGIAPIAWLPFVLLLLAAYFDELLSDRADRGEIRNKLEAFVARHRLSMDFMAVFLALLYQQPDFAISILLFDIGYQAVSMYASKNAPKIMRGRHLILDMFECNRKKLESESFVRDFLSAMPGKIGMTKIAGPFVVRFDPVDPKKKREWGISGIVIIAESHISCHTYPYKGTCKVDVYSCKDFDTLAAEKLVAASFRSRKYSTKVLSRALDEHLSLSDKSGAKTILEKERS